MRTKRCADKHSVVAEMFQNGGPELKQCLACAFNNMIDDNTWPEDWRHVICRMLPKGGDLSQVSNWRPIAVLDITYRIFSKILHGRIQPLLDVSQSPEQMGFRCGTSCDDALVAVEAVTEKAFEFNVHVWLVSIDLSKAFDRVERETLFEALADQELPDSYASVLK